MPTVSKDEEMEPSDKGAFAYFSIAIYFVPEFWTITHEKRVKGEKTLFLLTFDPIYSARTTSRMKIAGEEDSFRRGYVTEINKHAQVP